MATSLGKATLFINGDLKGLNSALGAAQKNIKKSFGNINDMAKQVGKGMTVAGGAIVAGLGYAVKGAVDFGTGMANVATLGVKDLGKLEDGLDRLAMTMGGDLVGSTKDLYDTISAGIPEDAAIKVMEAAAMGAKAGVGELGSALDAGTSILNSYNLKGKTAAETVKNFTEIQGKLTTAIKFGKTTMDELGASVGKIAPLASEAGMSIDSMLANVAALTTTGLSASESATGLKASLTAVLKPTEDAGKLTAALGIEFNGAALKAEGYTAFMQRVIGQLKEGNPKLLEQKKALEAQIPALEANIAKAKEQIAVMSAKKKKSAAEQAQLKTLKNALAQHTAELKKSKGEYTEIKKVGENWQGTAARIFGSVEALNAIMATTGSKMDIVTAATADMTNAGANLTEMFKAQTENDPAFMWAQLGASLQVVRKEIGQALLPMLKKMMDWLLPIVGEMTAWVKNNEELAGKITLVVAGLGAVMLALGPILIILPGIATAWSAIAVVAKLAWAAMLGPIGWAVVAIVALIAVVWYFGDEIGAAAYWIWEKLVWLFDKTVEGVIWLGSAISDIVQILWGGLKTGFTETVSFVFDMFSGAVGFVKDMIVGAWGWVVDMFTGAGELFKTIFSTVKDAILWPFKAAFKGIIVSWNWLLDKMNAISFTMPEFLGGETIGVNFEMLPIPAWAAATGRTNASGWGLVGELGPELVRLPMGSRVYDAQRSAEMMGGGGGLTVNVASLVVREEADVDRIARRLHSLQLDTLMAMGI